MILSSLVPNPTNGLADYGFMVPRSVLADAFRPDYERLGHFSRCHTVKVRLLAESKVERQCSVFTCFLFRIEVV